MLIGTHDVFVRKRANIDTNLNRAHTNRWMPASPIERFDRSAVHTSRSCSDITVCIMFVKESRSMKNLVCVLWGLSHFSTTYCRVYWTMDDGSSVQCAVYDCQIKGISAVGEAVARAIRGGPERLVQKKREVQRKKKKRPPNELTCAAPAS